MRGQVLATQMMSRLTKTTPSPENYSCPICLVRPPTHTSTARDPNPRDPMPMTPFRPSPRRLGPTPPQSHPPARGEPRPTEADG